MKQKGISIILCCYNSSRLLPETFRHLSAVKIPGRYPVELLVIDNASTDNTGNTATLLWQKYNVPFPMHVKRESKQGLMFAREKGLRESKYPLILFIDDDNWIDRNYLVVMAEIFEHYPKVAALGGKNQAVFETSKPVWFDRFKHSYAVGEPAGDFGEPKEIGLFGAGLCLRRKAYNQLVSNGFKSRLVGRTGESLSSGEDYELCKALKIAGWDILFSPKLKLQHYITSPRLNWEYLRKLNKGISRSIIWFLAYEFWIEKSKNPKNKIPDLKYSWVFLITKKFMKAKLLKLKMAIRPKLKNEGSPTIIDMERTQITIDDLFKFRNKFTQFKKEIGNANWNIINKGSI